MYGKELILDLHECDILQFNDDPLKQYLKELCELIDMEACDQHFWKSTIDEKPDPKIFGTSVIQFIITSNITIHALPLLGKIFINIFSCKDFDPVNALEFTVNFFKGRTANMKVVDRI